MATIAIIHTTPATIASLGALARELDPGLTVRNFLDDTILPEINREGGITPSVRARFYALAQAAALAGPDAVLCACSSVGELLEECRTFLPLPAYRIDEPMAEEAVRGSGRIAVAATLPSTLGPTMALLKRKAGELGVSPALVPLLVEGAGELLAQGRMEEYQALIAGAVAEAARTCDSIVLAQASMAGAAEQAGDLGSCSVLSSPRSGLRAVLDSLE